MCAVERCFSAFLYSINNILPPLVFIKIFFTFFRNCRHDSQIPMHSYNRMQAIHIDLFHLTSCLGLANMFFYTGRHSRRCCANRRMPSALLPTGFVLHINTNRMHLVSHIIIYNRFPLKNDHLLRQWLHQWRLRRLRLRPIDVL